MEAGRGNAFLAYHADTREAAQEREWQGWREGREGREEQGVKKCSAAVHGLGPGVHALGRGIRARCEGHGRGVQGWLHP